MLPRPIILLVKRKEQSRCDQSVKDGFPLRCEYDSSAIAYLRAH
jgi:hypothetical protein